MAEDFERQDNSSNQSDNRDFENNNRDLERTSQDIDRTLSSSIDRSSNDEWKAAKQASNPESSLYNFSGKQSGKEPAVLEFGSPYKQDSVQTVYKTENNKQDQVASLDTGKPFNIENPQEKSIYMDVSASSFTSSSLQSAQKGIEALGDLDKASKEIPLTKGLRDVASLAKGISEKMQSTNENDKSSMQELSKSVQELSKLISSLSKNDMQSLTSILTGKLSPQEMKLLDPQGLVLQTLSTSLENGILPVAEKLGQASKNPNVVNLESAKFLTQIKWSDYSPWFGGYAGHNNVELPVDGKKEQIPLNFPDAELNSKSLIKFDSVKSQYDYKTGNYEDKAKIVATIYNENGSKQQYSLEKDQSGNFSWKPLKK